jgi:hypothetical protein
MEKSIELRAMFHDGQTQHLFFEAPPHKLWLMPAVLNRCKNLELNTFKEDERESIRRL